MLDEQTAHRMFYRRPIIYLSSPFTGTNEEQDWRVQSVGRATRHFAKEGLQVFSPILYGSAVGIDATWDWWMAFDLKLLRAMDEFWLLQINGWRQSVGCYKELQAAKDLMPVYTVSWNYLVEPVEPDELMEAFDVHV